MGALTLRAGKNPLGAGFYTIREAARLIEVGSVPRIRGWLRGYPNRDIGPLLRRDFAPIKGVEELSFLDLMEVRFVEFFREEGVKTRTLRKALDLARAVYNESKPLASQKVVFRTTKDRKNVFAEEILPRAADEGEDKALLDLLKRGQYEIYDFMEDRLAQGVIFDPRIQLASRWYPRKDNFPDIFIEPKTAYGQPVTKSLVPTSIIYHAHNAGDETPEIADWFSVPIDDVLQAIDFEASLADRAKRKIN